MAYGNVNVPGDLSGKQDRLHGTAGQLVGFDAAGNAVPTDHGQGVFYGQCYTAHTSAEKTATIKGFELKTGVVVILQFLNRNDVESPTLNINGTGAKAIKRLTTNDAEICQWSFGSAVPFVYNGTCWLMLDGTIATTMFYGTTKLSSAVNSESEDLAATPKAVKQAYDLAESRQAKLNILDNPYFTINQKGITETTVWNGRYHLDRWVGDRVDVKVTSGGLSFAMTETSAMDNGYIQQRLELERITGDTVTLSALIDGTLHTYTRPVKNQRHTDNSEVVDDITLNLEWKPEMAPDTLRITIRNYSKTAKVIKAVKLELGGQQTLAHQDGNGNWILNDPPPDRALELAKCQRYMMELVSPLDRSYSPIGIGMADTASLAKIFVPIPVALRTKPQVTFSGTIKIIEIGTTFKTLVTNIAFDHMSNNMLVLNVTTETNIVVEKHYTLWGYVPLEAGQRHSILLDANL